MKEESKLIELFKKYPGIADSSKPKNKNIIFDDIDDSNKF
jgi:hypothetical protein